MPMGICSIGIFFLGLTRRPESQPSLPPFQQDCVRASLWTVVDVLYFAFTTAAN